MLLSEKEWEAGLMPAGNTSAINIPKDKLHQVFSENGDLLTSMDLRLTGDISGIPALLAQCNLHAARLPHDDGYLVLRFIPEPVACIDSAFS